MQKKPLIVVDAANGVGSVPDGWWRDRRGAATRLRDSLDGLADAALQTADAPGWARQAPLDVVMVAEGAARGLGSSDTVRVVSAPAGGDDTIVDVVRRDGADRQCLVVTADRELCSRVEALGPETRGPGVLLGYHRPRRTGRSR